MPNSVNSIQKENKDLLNYHGTTIKGTKESENKSINNNSINNINNINYILNKENNDKSYIHTFNRNNKENNINSMKIPLNKNNILINNYQNKKKNNNIIINNNKNIIHNSINILEKPEKLYLMTKSPPKVPKKSNNNIMLYKNDNEKISKNVCDNKSIKINLKIIIPDGDETSISLKSSRKEKLYNENFYDSYIVMKNRSKENKRIIKGRILGKMKIMIFIISTTVNILLFKYMMEV